MSMIQLCAVLRPSVLHPPKTYSSIMKYEFHQISSRYSFGDSAALAIKKEQTKTDEKRGKRIVCHLLNK